MGASAAIVHGSIQPYEWKQTCDFTASKDETGKWKGQASFNCRKYDFAILSLTTFRRGVPIGAVVNAKYAGEWSFLLIETTSHQHKAGGITEITVTFGGRDPNDSDKNEDELTYGLKATTTEACILEKIKKAESPGGITEAETAAGALSADEYEMITRLFNNQLFVRPAKNDSGDTAVYLVDIHEADFGKISSANGLEWYNEIFKRGHRTYDRPLLVWYKKGSNIGGLPAERMKRFSYIDPNPENLNPEIPKAFPDRNWRLMEMSCSQSSGTNKNTTEYELGWHMSPGPGDQKFPVKIYTMPTT